MPDPIRLGFPVSFLEAIRWAENRKAVLPEAYYGELAKELRSTAFTVSSISRLDVIERIMNSLTEQTRAGATFASWKKWVAENAPEVLQLPKGRAETIFRNAIQTNYGAGRWEQQWAARDVFPYLMYSAVNDARTRPAHRALSGIIRPIDDPFWQTHTPPLGHNCRCSTIALTEKQAQRRSGVDTGLNKPIIPDKMRADPGWDYHPVLQQTRMEEIAKQKLDRMGAMMRIALENAARAAPVVPLAEKALGDMTLDEVDRYGDWKANQLVKNFNKKVDDAANKLKQLTDEIARKQESINSQYGMWEYYQKLLDNGDIDISKFGELTEALDKKVAGLWNEIDELKKENAKLFKPVDQLLKAISKEKWSKFDKKDINKYLNKYTFTFSDDQRALENKTRIAAKRFLEQFGPTEGRGLKEFKYIKNRAHASMDGYINVGDASIETIFHEWGHHCEFERYFASRKAVEWRNAKSSTLEPKPLGGHFDADEVALPDDYISPYVGKVYRYQDKDGNWRDWYTTEVISMGIERFSDSESLLKFIMRDRSHFNFIIAILFK